MAEASPVHEHRQPRRYLVERYWPGLTLDGLRRDEASIRAAAQRVTGGGRRTTFLGSTFVPSEGTVLSVFEAGDEAWVLEVNRLAGVPVHRILDVVDGRGADPAAARGRAVRPPIAGQAADGDPAARPKEDSW
jgi:hypothetical protein